MTSYFFDLVADDSEFADSEGSALPDDDAALAEARKILGDILRQGMGSNFDVADHGALLVVVRTAASGTIARVSLTLSVDR